MDGDKSHNHHGSSELTAVVGSSHRIDFGLLPPDFIANDSSEVRQNPGQQYLWDCFNDMISWAAGFRIDAIFINGDLIDGKQPKSNGAELCLPLPNDQEEAAVFTLRFLRNKLQKLLKLEPDAEVPFYVVQGTEYHDGRGASESAEVHVSDGLHSTCVRRQFLSRDNTAHYR